MAANLYNMLTKSNDAESAGTHVHENEGQFIGENGKAKFVIQVANEEGIDLTKFRRKQLTNNITKDFDKIIVMSRIRKKTTHFSA